MPKKHYAGDVQQAIAAEIEQLRAQQRTAPAPSRAKSGSFVPPPRAESAPFGGSGGAEIAPGSPTPQPSPDALRRRGVEPPPAYGAATTPIPSPAPPVTAYAPPPAPAYAPPPASAPALPSTTSILVSLDQRINRLEQVRQWIGEDGEMARFLDTVIGQQVKSSERRQARLALVLNIIFLIAGWALSYFLSPANTFGKLLGL